MRFADGGTSTAHLAGAASSCTMSARAVCRALALLAQCVELVLFLRNVRRLCAFLALCGLTSCCVLALCSSCGVRRLCAFLAPISVSLCASVLSYSVSLTFSLWLHLCAFASLYQSPTLSHCSHCSSRVLSVLSLL